MNKTLVLITISIFTFISNVQAQKNQAELTFKNGKVLTGFGRVIRNEIKFRINKKEPAMVYPFAVLKKAKIYYKGNNGVATTYLYMNIKNKDKPKVLYEWSIGKVSLYLNSYLAGQYPYHEYYVKKENEKEVTYLGNSRWRRDKFMKILSNYFKDCPSLVYKIHTAEFKNGDMKQIIEYYNKICE